MVTPNGQFSTDQPKGYVGKVNVNRIMLVPGLKPTKLPSALKIQSKPLTLDHETLRHPALSFPLLPQLVLSSCISKISHTVLKCTTVVPT